MGRSPGQVSTPERGSRKTGRATDYARFVARGFLRSRSRRSVSLIGGLSALGFLVGVAALIIALAMITGFQNAMISKILGANAQLLVFPRNGSRTIANPGAVIDTVTAVPGVTAAAPVVSTKGVVLAAGGRMHWVTINGIDPERGQQVTDLESSMVAGSLADLGRPTLSQRPPLIMGEELATELGLIQGDPVTLLVPRPKLTPWGVGLKQTVFEVVGFFSTDYYEYDSTWVMIGYHRAQRMLGVDAQAHWIAGRVVDLRQLYSIEASVQERLGEEFQVTDLLRSNRALFSALKLEKLLMFLAVGLIVIVAALSVISTLVLTVTQKVRDIGVLMAMGATPRGILRIFVIQGMGMGLVGTVGGVLVGVGLSWVLDAYELIPLDSEVYYLGHVAFIVRGWDVAAVALVSVVIAFISTLYPAWRASRLDPVEALRRD